mmetsp:Transcript_9222/g.12432  ORF Transcript_9222/g.12432 Transcript_9222/m.12432 type:complete len:94 (+) Transcript_9222:50-331(+)
MGMRVKGPRKTSRRLGGGDLAGKEIVERMKNLMNHHSLDPSLLEQEGKRRIQEKKELPAAKQNANPKLFLPFPEMFFLFQKKTQLFKFLKILF